MLKGIPPVLSPELLKVLCEMGHGDEIVIGDANFPACSINNRVVRADSISACVLLDAILKVIPLDTYSDSNLFLMEVVPGDNTPTPIWDDYQRIADSNDSNVRIGHIERFAFYERAKKAYAVIASGETAIYGNIIIKKGVIK